MARHLHTPVSEVEDMEWDRFAAYQASLARILKSEQPKSRGR
jgi:hypothetical protein